jgi:hypothetical protein
MIDYYYKLDEGKGPTIDDYRTALRYNVKYPINLALDVLEDITLPEDEHERDKSNGAICTLQAALIAWEQIDKAIMADLDKAEAVSA